MPTKTYYGFNQNTERMQWVIEQITPSGLKVMSVWEYDESINARVRVRMETSLAKESSREFERV